MFGPHRPAAGRRGGSGRGIHQVWSVGTALATHGPFSTLVVPN